MVATPRGDAESVASGRAAAREPSCCHIILSLSIYLSRVFFSRRRGELFWFGVGQTVYTPGALVSELFYFIHYTLVFILKPANCYDSDALCTLCVLSDNCKQRLACSSYLVYVCFCIWLRCAFATCCDSLGFVYRVLSSVALICVTEL